MLGAFFIAPFLHFNYCYTLPYVAGSSTNHTIIALKKIIFDQLVLAPTYFFMFYHVVNKIDGKFFSHANDQLIQKFWPTMIANWKIWPMVNFLNFLIIPIHYQVLWNNFFSLFFNAYLSFMHNSYSSSD